MAHPTSALPPHSREMRRGALAAHYAQSAGGRHAPLPSCKPLAQTCRAEGGWLLCRSTMNLDAFDSIKTLEELRSFIPELGKSIKTFAVSRNDRYCDPNSFRWVHVGAHRCAVDLGATSAALSEGQFSVSSCPLVNWSEGCEQTHHRSDNLHCANQCLHSLCD